MAITLDGTSGITFPSAAVQADSAIGYGQTWTNVTASRALGTTYTNSTGRPIFVMVAASNNVNASWGLITPVVAGTTLPDARAIVNQSYATISFIVPSGATYVLTTSGSISLQAWAELR